MVTFSHLVMRIHPRTLAWIFTGLLLIGLGIFLFTPDSQIVTVLDLYFPVMGFFASAVLYYTAWCIRSESTRLAQAWLYLALGCLAWTLGEFSWAVIEVFLGLDPFPSIADVFYLLYYPLVIVGFLLIPHEPRRLAERLMNGLDLTIVFLAAGLFYWNFLIGPLMVDFGADWLSFLISMAYPVFDLVLFAALMLLLYRKQKALRPEALFFLSLSILIQFVADTIYGLQSIAGTYQSGTPLDYAWQMGFAAFGLAGVYQLVGMGDAEAKKGMWKAPAFASRLYFWLTFTPYLWLVAAYALLLYAQFVSLPMSFEAISIMIGVMLALVVTRQAISIHERSRLAEQLKQELIERQRAEQLLQKSHDELELRVHQRTSDLSAANRRLVDEIEERRRAETQLETSLHDKEVLLKEIHHRVKNNLQVISSLLKLQANQVHDPAVEGALMDSQIRVQTMALIHEKLYQSVNLEQIEFSEYLQSLITFLNRSYNSAQRQVSLRLEAEPIPLHIDTAMPCGLIVNELVSNALKHAFPNGRCGEIVTILRSRPEGGVEVSVSDNGVGVPEGVDVLSSTSLGLQLVRSLVGQLDGELRFERSPVTRFTITF